MNKKHKNKLELNFKKHDKSMKILSWRNAIDDCPINIFEKVKRWLATQNEFENLELLSEVASQQEYLRENDKLNVKIINQSADISLSNDLNLNQGFKSIALS